MYPDLALRLCSFMFGSENTWSQVTWSQVEGVVTSAYAIQNSASKFSLFDVHHRHQTLMQGTKQGENLATLCKSLIMFELLLYEYESPAPASNERLSKVPQSSMSTSMTGCKGVSRRRQLLQIARAAAFDLDGTQVLGVRGIAFPHLTPHSKNKERQLKSWISIAVTHTLRP